MQVEQAIHERNPELRTLLAHIRERHVSRQVAHMNGLPESPKESPYQSPKHQGSETSRTNRLSIDMHSLQKPLLPGIGADTLSPTDKELLISAANSTSKKSKRANRTPPPPILFPLGSPSKVKSQRLLASKSALTQIDQSDSRNNLNDTNLAVPESFMASPPKSPDKEGEDKKGVEIINEEKKNGDVEDVMHNGTIDSENGVRDAQVFAKGRHHYKMTNAERLLSHAQPQAYTSVLQNENSQVEEWLGVIIAQAGHSVVVPEKLRSDMDKMQDVDEGLANSQNIITKLHNSTKNDDHRHNPYQNTLKDVFLDKDSLGYLGLPKEIVLRIYRALFVYSVGFHDVIADIHKHSVHAEGISSVVWQTFVYLLERVESRKYETMLSKISNDHKCHVDLMQERFDCEAAILEEEKAALKSETEANKSNIRALEESNEKERQKSEALQREMEDCIRKLKEDNRQVNLTSRKRKERVDECEEAIGSLQDELNELREELSIAQAKHHDFLEAQAKERERKTSMISAGETETGGGGGGGGGGERAPDSPKAISPIGGGGRRISAAQRRKTSQIRRNFGAGVGRQVKRRTFSGSEEEIASPGSGKSSVASSPRGRKSLALAAEIIQRRATAATVAAQPSANAAMKSANKAVPQSSSLTPQHQAVHGLHIDIPNDAVVLSPGSHIPPGATVLNLKEGESLPEKLNSKDVQIIYVQVAQKYNDRNDRNNDEKNSKAADAAPSTEGEYKDGEIKLNDKLDDKLNDKLDDKINLLKQQHQHHISSIHDSHQKKIDELDREIGILASALEEQTLKCEELEETLAGDDDHEEELHHQIDELQLQLRVTEAHRDDLLAVNGEKMEEIAGLKENIEREKQYRQELNGKVRHANHMQSLVEQKLDAAEKTIAEERHTIVVQKENNNRLRDKLYDTEKSMNDEIDAKDALQEKYDTDTSNLEDRLRNVSAHARREEIKHAAHEFMSGSNSALLVKYKMLFDGDEKEIRRLHVLIDDLRVAIENEKTFLMKEKESHCATQKKYELEAAENDASLSKLRVTNDNLASIKIEKAELEAQLKLVTRKFDAKKASFESLKNDLDMANSVISELEEAIEKQTNQHEAQMNDREGIIDGLREEVRVLEDFVESNREENENRDRMNAQKLRELAKMSAELTLARSEKNELVAAMESLRKEGAESLAMMESWLGGKGNKRFRMKGSIGTGASRGGAGARGGPPRRGGPRAAKRKMSIFEQNIGETPPPLNLKTASDRLLISQADFQDDLRQEMLVKKLGDKVSENVRDIILASSNIKKIARRVDAAHDASMLLKDEKFKHIMELKQCKKEFQQLEEHWKNVNISLSKAAREESAGLKRELNKKKTLLIAARKMTENNAAKIKSQAKDIKNSKKKLDKTARALQFTHEQIDMAAEDARAQSMRFLEVRHLQKISTVAHTVMHNVFSGIWERIVPYPGQNASLGGNAGADSAGNIHVGVPGGIFPPVGVGVGVGGGVRGGGGVGVGVGVGGVSSGTASPIQQLNSKLNSPKPMPRRRGSIIYESGTNLAGAPAQHHQSQHQPPSHAQRRKSSVIPLSMMTASIVDVSSLWLSPTQVQLEKVVSGLQRVDNIFQHVQHVASTSTSHLKDVQEHHEQLLSKYRILSEWSQKETLRKSGLKDFGAQYNNTLLEPRVNMCQTDVTWLQRVPQVKNTHTGNEKIIVPMVTRFDELQKDVRAGVRHMHDANAHHTFVDSDNTSSARGHQKNANERKPIRITTKGNGVAEGGGDMTLLGGRKHMSPDQLVGAEDGEDEAFSYNDRDIDSIVKAAASPTSIRDKGAAGQSKSPVKPTKPRGRAMQSWTKAKTIASAFGKSGGGRGGRSNSPTQFVDRGGVAGGGGRGARVATNYARDKKSVNQNESIPYPNYK